MGCNFDIYDAIVLHDAVIRCEKGLLTKEEAATYVSKVLRDRAIAAGKEINEQYRSELGISGQFRRMQYVVTGGRKGSKRHTQLFEEVALMYNDDREHYEKLLSEVIGRDGETPVSGAQIPDTQVVSESSNEIDGVDPFLRYLDANNVEYIDKRKDSSRLWIIDKKLISNILREATRQGIALFYDPHGCVETNQRSAWWTTGQTDEFTWEMIPEKKHVPASTRTATEETGSTKNISNGHVGEQANEDSAGIKRGNCVLGFGQWLLNKGIEWDATNIYCTAIIQIEEWLKVRGNECRFYGSDDVKEIKCTIAKLVADSDFLSFSTNHSYMLRPALLMYESFISDLGKKEAICTVSVDDSMDANDTSENTVASSEGNDANDRYDMREGSESITQSHRELESEISEVEVPREASAFHGLHNTPRDFRKWLLGKGYSETSADIYINCIEIVEKYVKINYNFSFYCNDSKSIVNRITLLLVDKDFQKFKRQRFMPLTKALKEYSSFVEDAKCEVSDSAPASQEFQRASHRRDLQLVEKNKDAQFDSSVHALDGDEAAGKRQEKTQVNVTDTNTCENSSDSFGDWMKEQGMSKSSIDLILQEIDDAREYLDEHNTEHYIFCDTDKETIRTNLNKLLEELEFYDGYLRQHIFARSALNTYGMFVESLVQKTKAELKSDVAKSKKDYDVPSKKEDRGIRETTVDNEGNAKTTRGAKEQLPARSQNDDVEHSDNKSSWANSSFGFRHWLLDENYSMGLAREYAKSIERVDCFLSENGYESFQFYGNDNVTNIADMIRTLSDDALFKSFDARLYGKPFRALTQFLLFVESRAAQNGGHGYVSRKGSDTNISFRGRKSAIQKVKKLSPAKKTEVVNTKEQSSEKMRHNSVISTASGWSDSGRKSSRQTDTFSRNDKWDNSADGFRRWMVKEGIPKEVARAHASAIWDMQKYVRNHGDTTFKFYWSYDVESITRMIDALRVDAEFIEFDSKQHNRYRYALTRFRTFVMAHGK